MKRRFLGTAVIALALLAFAAPATADTVTLSGCASCFGATYTLTVTNVSGNTYHAILTIDTSAYSGPGTVISAVSFKATSDVIPPVTLTAAPGGLAGWSTQENNINNAGCTGNGKGFVCSADAAPITLAPVGGILTWEWDFTLPSGGSIFPNLTGAHIGAKYNNAAGTLNGNIVSETVPVPEPGTLALFGAGLLGMAGAIRRRLSR